jgi:UDP-glucose 4-epimerase
MLKHNYPKEHPPDRVVVLGGGGFIGGEIVKALKTLNISVLSLERKDIDLLNPVAENQLVELLKPSDVLVFAAAIAPCKDLDMLQDNIKIADVVCRVIKKIPPSQIVYVSSDAVYRDSLIPLTENSCAEPESLHGIMHLTREIALRNCYIGPLVFVRPTLVYGLNDPHNGYGPNRFRRLASSGEKIVLFGEGEELRDHVDVQDVANLIRNVILFQSTGIINAVSGETVSFRKLAEFATEEFASSAPIVPSVRIGNMPHGGYRAFDNSAVHFAFPGFIFKSWREGLHFVHQSQLKKSKLRDLQ